MIDYPPFLIAKHEFIRIMKKIEPNYLPEELYFKELQLINGIKFSQREIDIVACIASSKSTKRIASLLSISPKTVATHIRNIMLKLEVNSRDSIIEFFEDYSSLALLRTYYALVRKNIFFKNSLLEISRMDRHKVPITLKISVENSTLFNKLSENLKAYLELAGIYSEIKKEQGNVIHLLVDVDNERA